MKVGATLQVQDARQSRGALCAAPLMPACLRPQGASPIYLCGVGRSRSGRCLYWGSPFRKGMPTAPDPRNNHLLAALPASERERWSPLLGAVDLPLGRVLCASGRSLEHVYFPIDSIVSLLYVMEDGSSAEIAVSATKDWWHLAVHAGRNHAEPRRRPERGEGLAAVGAGPVERIQPGGPRAAPAAVYAGPRHPDGANRRVQPPPLPGPAVVPVAATQPRPVGRQ